MEIKNQALLEQLHAKKLAVFRDQSSTLKQVIEAYDQMPDTQPKNTPYINYCDEK